MSDFSPSKSWRLHELLSSRALVYSCLLRCFFTPKRREHWGLVDSKFLWKPKKSSNKYSKSKTRWTELFETTNSQLNTTAKDLNLSFLEGYKHFSVWDHCQNRKTGHFKRRSEITIQNCITGRPQCQNFSSVRQFAFMICDRKDKSCKKKTKIK